VVGIYASCADALMNTLYVSCVDIMVVGIYISCIVILVIRISVSCVCDGGGGVVYILWVFSVPLVGIQVICCYTGC